MNELKFPKEIFFVTGNKNRLYYSRGHVKLSLNHNPYDRVFKAVVIGWKIEWMDITEEFR